MPNKVALRRTDTNELLGLMVCIADGKSLAMEIVYVESVDHSSTDLLRAGGKPKKYIGIANAFFAYAVAVSIENGYDGVWVFKVTTLIISKKPGNTGISQDIRTEFTTDLLLSD